MRGHQEVSLSDMSHLHQQMITVEHNEVNGEKSSAHPKFTEEIKEIAERESVDFDDASVHKP